MLVDVRTDQARSTSGVAELKRGALGKGAAVPPVRVRPLGLVAVCPAACRVTALRCPAHCAAPPPLLCPPSPRGCRLSRAAPCAQLPPSVSRRVRDPAAVALEIQALEVAALAKVSPGSTRVIVMDGQVREAGQAGGGSVAS